MPSGLQGDDSECFTNKLKLRQSALSRNRRHDDSPFGDMSHPDVTVGGDDDFTRTGSHVHTGRDEADRKIALQPFIPGCDMCHRVESKDMIEYSSLHRILT